MRFYDLQNLTLFKNRKKHGILELLHKKIAQPLFLLHFQHIVQWHQWHQLHQWASHVAPIVKQRMAARLLLLKSKEEKESQVQVQGSTCQLSIKKLCSELMEEEKECYFLQDPTRGGFSLYSDIYSQPAFTIFQLRPRPPESPGAVGIPHLLLPSNLPPDNTPSPIINPSLVPTYLRSVLFYPRPQVLFISFCHESYLASYLWELCGLKQT